MKRQIKSKFLYMFKFYFVDKNKFNQISKEIILNYVVKNTSLRRKIVN